MHSFGQCYQIARKLGFKPSEAMRLAAIQACEPRPERALAKAIKLMRLAFWVREERT